MAPVVSGKGHTREGRSKKRVTRNKATTINEFQFASTELLTLASTCNFTNNWTKNTRRRSSSSGFITSSFISCNHLLFSLPPTLNFQLSGQFYCWPVVWRIFMARKTGLQVAFSLIFILSHWEILPYILSSLENSRHVFRYALCVHISFSLFQQLGSLILVVSTWPMSSYSHQERVHSFMFL